MLGAILFFVSCNNEEVTEGISLEVEESLTPDNDFESDEGDLIMELNEASEILVQPNPGLFAKSSKGGNSSCVPDIEGLVASLPESVSARTTSKPGVDSYFTLEILDSNLAGADIPAWCADQDLSLGVEGPLDFDVYSTYGTLPEGVFEKPENFDLVNWLLNQTFIGESSPSGGTYNFGHIQYAIWLLVDDSVCQECTFLTDPTGEWNDDPTNVTKAEELAAAAVANGEGYEPGCGDKFGVLLVPDGKQSLIITLEVPEKPCDDCEGKVTELTMEFDWRKAKRVKIYQKRGNTCWGVKVFDKVLQPGEEFTINGANNNGTFGKFIYIYVGNSYCHYYTKIRTDCKLNIGPGYERGVFNVVSGKSSRGGELCEYVKPEYNCWIHRHWNSNKYPKYRKRNHGY